MDNLIFQNYHKHTYWSNIKVADSATSLEEYCKRAVELGHGIISSVEHGWQGHYIECHQLAEKYGLKFVFGTEAYWVKDRLALDENGHKDGKNCHIVLIAMNENGRQAINDILSQAAIDGYYRQSRIDLELILSLPADDVVCTTACIAFHHYEDTEEIIKTLHNHFGNNFYLEVQYHNTDPQKAINKKILSYRKKYGIQLIMGCDSHYIDEKGALDRDEFIKSKGMEYPDEEGWYMDYPDGETAYKRFVEQCVLSHNEIMEAMNNTNIFLNVEEYDCPIFNHDIKMPTLYPSLTQQERDDKLEKLIWDKWSDYKKEVPVERHDEYEEQIRYELDIVKKTFHSDYFLLDYAITQLGKEKGGQLTLTGRGCFVGEALVLTDTGYKCIKDIKVGDKVVCKTGEFTEVADTFKYDIDEELVQVKYLGSCNKVNPVICTTDHKFLTYDINTNQEAWKPACDLIPNKDYVCFPKIKTNKSQNKVIDLNDYNIFGFEYDDNFIYEKYDSIGKPYKYSPSDVARHLGCGKSVIENYANGKRTHFKARNGATDKDVLLYTGFSTAEEYREYVLSKKIKRINRYLPLDHIMGEFIGMMYGDGYTNKSKIEIGFAINTASQKNIVNRGIFNEIANRIGIEVYENVSKTKSLSQLYLRSKCFSQFIHTELFVSEKEKDKTFNNKFLYQSNEVIKGIANGLFITDGCLDKDNRLNFDNTSLSIIGTYKILRSMCEDYAMGIDVRPEHIDNRGYHSKTSYKVRRLKKGVIETNDYWLLPVKEIIRLPQTKTSVYDISVPYTNSFVLDNCVVHNSGVSFFLNKLLGFTSVDRISANVKMYPERFMSPTRILETHSLADIDMNVAVQEPFWEAQEELLGFEHSKQMIAYQQLKPAAAWKMYAKSQNVDYDTSNEISKQIAKYLKDYAKAKEEADDDEEIDIDILDYIEEQYKDIYLKSTDYLGVVSAVTPHACFDGEELVNTSDGLMPIKNICIGDIVLTKENEYKMVTNTFITENSPIGIIDIQGRPKMKVTPNHPFLCKHMMRGKGNYREFSEEEWVSAEDLKKDDFVCAEIINNKSIIPTFMDVPTDNPTFWWLVGRYIGDGWLKKFYYNRPWEYVVTICVAFNQLEDITKKLDKLGIYKYWVETSRTTYKIHINNKNLYYFLWQFGRGAGNKFIPNFVIDMPKNLLESMLDGYVSADGCIRPDAIVATTISKRLALTLSSCIAKVYGTYAGVRSILKKENILEGRILKPNTQYLIRFRKERKQKDSYIVDKQNRIWVRFHNYAMLESVQTVYNFEVEDSHTYCVNNIVVHNCASLVYEGNIRKEIGYIFVKSSQGEGRLCCCMDGKWAEKYGFLKNDWLKVNVVEVIYKIFERIGMTPFSSTELIEKCKTDLAPWKLYKQQCTKGLNQVEQPSSSTKVGAYAPTNISELTAFVAAVRPGFKSMYDIFESREHFDYNIPTFDNLLQTEEMPNSFVLYQEQAMLTLNYAGIPMSECYAVIKAISKKRVDEITKNKPIFIDGFTKKIQEDEGIPEYKAEEIAHRVWQIIEDSSKYSFNSAHAYSVALDSLYQAWLKTHYPLEFYETYMNILNRKKAKDRLNRFKDEAEHYFNIVFPPYRFKQDNRAITIDKEKNAINNALSSIKGYSDSIAEALYECGLKTKDFIHALKYLDDLSIKSAKVIPLIKIGYFSEFGNENALLKFIEYWDILKQGMAKQLSKDKADDLLTRLVPYYANDKNKDGSESKSWKLNSYHMYDLLKDILFECQKLEPPTYKAKMAWQQEILGYIELTTCKPEDTKRILILEVKPLIGQYSDDPWCYKVETRSIGTGRTASLNIDAKTWNAFGELTPMDIIDVGRVFKNKKGYWYIGDYKKEYV